MKRVILVALLSVTGLLAACSTGNFYHDNFMSGQVVAVENDQAVICIGSTNNLSPGTSFEVFEVIYEGTIIGAPLVL